MPTQAELLVIEAERLKALEQLLTDIEQSNQIGLDPQRSPYFKGF
ncbi:MAG: hypothetical protein P1U36_07705 [Legionellaceae bacterium]|nr:hypothetical protein [Legionellaceae bacterium]